MSASDKSKGSSTFSRLANYVPNALSSSSSLQSVSSSSSTGGGGGGPTSGSNPPGGARGLEALDAVGRLRQGGDPPSPSGAGSRSRERDRSLPNSPMFSTGSVFESPGAYSSYHGSRIRQHTVGSTSSQGQWGNETLPPNAASNYSHSHSASAFSFAIGSAYTDGGHFFPPGMGGFSFEGESPTQQQSQQPGGFHYRDRSNRFSVLEPKIDLSWQSSGGGNSQGSSGRQSRYGSPSRALKYVLSGGAAGERGLVALAKPKDNGEGRVAVAGKSFLKLLKVPERAPSSNETPPSTSVGTTSSLASRRSRSRGSPVPVAEGSPAYSRAGDRLGQRSRSRGPEDIVELMDVRAGSRLSPTYLFSDVRWGYGDTAHKLGTSFSNGAIALWDLNREGPNRLDTPPKHQHDRAINQVVFAGPAGNYLLSAGQDGQIKLWDIRQERPSTNKLKASSPVQRVKFSPSASQSWMLLATCSSGTLIRYDLRNLSSAKANAAMIDRVAGHVGACLAMDWRDNYQSDGDRRDGGWVVTSGVDRTIKIWDFSLPTLSTRPVRTLYPGQPVQDVAWHPTRGTELACSPMPSMGVVQDENAAGGSSISLETGKVGSSLWRKNEIEIWDTRRPYYPKLSIKTEDSVSSITYNDDHTLWGTSKTSAVFSQYDIARDSYSLLDSVPPANATWNIDGELLFAGGASASLQTSWKKHSENQAVDAPVFVPDSFFNSVTNFDPDFSGDAFSYLANALVWGGKTFGEICDLNAEAYDYVGRSDASQLWNTLKIWFDAPPISFPDSPPPTPPIPEVSKPPLTASEHLNEWLLSPTATLDLATAPNHGTGRRSFGSSSISRSRGLHTSPLITPLDAPVTPLDIFHEESKSKLSEKSGPLSRRGSHGNERVSSSDSEEDRPARLRAFANNSSRARSATIGALTPLLSIDNNVEDPTLDGLPEDDDFGLPPSARDNSLSRRQPGRRSSGGTDSEGEENNLSRARAAKLSRIPSHHRRKSSSLSKPGRDNSGFKSRQASADRHSVAYTQSRRGSAQHGNSGGGAVAKAPAEVGPTMAEKANKVALEYLDESTKLIKAQVRATLQEYADRGDTQLCATVCCALQDKDMAFTSLFVARVNKAYLDLLRRAKCYVAAASVIKFCETESIRTLSENTVVFHTACGKCGKALDQSPFGICSRCNSLATRCCICNLGVRELFVFCASCGHGAHSECLASYSTALSAERWEGFASHDASFSSYPSTPGVVTPGARAWLYGEMDEHAKMQRQLECPVGACGHSPCLLTAHDE